jgi:hypothetical protein
MTCHNCSKKEHIKPNCPEFDKDKYGKDDATKKKKLESILKKKQEDEKTVTFVQHKDSKGNMGFVNLTNMQVNKPQVELCNIVLLDNQLTMDIFCNPQLVKKIWENNEEIKIHGNGRSLHTKKKALIHNYRVV